MPYALPQEKAVTLFVNGQKAVTLMASPEKLRALAIGFLYNAGMIREVSQIETLYACEEDARLMIEGNGIDYTPDTFVPLIASGCGAASRALPADLPKNTSRVQFSMQKIRSGFLRMLRDNTLYQKTGGMHTAALLSGSYFALAEDIGRHNAHDKVTGEALQAGVLLPEAAILSTGRIQRYGCKGHLCACAGPGISQHPYRFGAAVCTGVRDHPDRPGNERGLYRLFP